MNLADLMDPRLVDLEMRATSAPETLRLLVSRMVDAGLLEGSEDALRRLEEREQVMSTGIGGGIAIPHARSPQVKKTLIALGRSAAGVPFNAVDDQPVTAIFLILGPPDSSAEHVKVLGLIARLVRQADFMARLTAANSVDDVLAMVRLSEAPPA